MKRDEYDQYEYARKRIKRRKRFFYHSILFLIGSLAMFVANSYLNVIPDTKWYQWGIAFWLLILILHFVKVFVTDQFMGKEWEREQINKLVKKQQEKTNQLEKELGNYNPENNK